MKNAFNDIKDLFYPRVCPVCGARLPEDERFLCNYCRWEIPLTDFWKNKNNPVAEIFYGHIPVENASSFYFYVHNSGFRDLIHGFKYRGAWHLAQKMGEWFGAELSESELYGNIDLIIPIPLHLRKRLRRGYNQAEYIARGIAKSMKIPVDIRSVARHRYNVSQTRKHKKERWDNVAGIFKVRNPEDLKSRHILLVDDVLTTGATIISCAETILRTVPDCRVSIATLAVSKNEIETSGKRLDFDGSLPPLK